MLSDEQIDKVSDLFIDIAKGLFVAAFAVQFITRYDIIIFWKYISSATIISVLAIKMLDFKRK